MSAVEVVVVAYNSRERLRGCVEPLAGLEGVQVVVVDNASSDGSLAAVADLPVTRIALPENGGFARGCNAGWRAGAAPFVLFINPDASIDEHSLRRLVRTLEEDRHAGAAAPRIVHATGGLDFSQRRFPRRCSTYSQALFLHRLFPRAAWTDEVVRDECAYAGAGSPDWVSGACVLVRRSSLQALDGLDEGFFLYCEDTDLCRRLRALGYEVRFVPEAVCVHEGGASTPRGSLLPVLAASRIRYARKHDGRPAAVLERLGVALSALTHTVVSRGGRRRGHARSLRVALSRNPSRTARVV